MSINLRNVWGKNIANNHYNNNQSSHNVLVENTIICNLFIHKPSYESITTMQLIFCVTGKSGTCLFINLCNLWEKTSPVIIIKTTTTKLATM